MESEEKLAGGNMTAVTRIGDTVRRDVGSWTEQVHMLLAHLRAKGIQEVPAPLGFDEQGREILTFIPGLVGHFPLPELRIDKVLISAARLLRLFTMQQKISPKFIRWVGNLQPENPSK
jgi:hypothetical protein